jgi:hypothetical protein
VRIIWLHIASDGLTQMYTARTARLRAESRYSCQAQFELGELKLCKRASIFSWHFAGCIELIVGKKCHRCFFGARALPTIGEAEGPARAGTRVVLDHHASFLP